MGLVADLSYCEGNFWTPQFDENQDINVLIGSFTAYMHAFNIELGFAFDAKGGVGGNGKTREPWQIGLVQNSIYEYIRYEYEGDKVFSTEFINATLDSTSTENFPFYGAPATIDVSLEGGSSSIPLSVPVKKLWLSSEGIHRNPNGGPITGEKWSVNLVDQPKFGGRTHLANGAMIKQAERILSFRVWLVAKAGEQLRVLSYSTPFTLVSTLTFAKRDPNKEYGRGTTAPTALYYGVDGILKFSQLRERHRAKPNVKVLGYNKDAKVDPVTTGITSNDQGRNWLRVNKLLP